MADDTKHTEVMPVRWTERELLDIVRLAALADRKPSEWVRWATRQAMYGMVQRPRNESEGT